MSKKKKKKSHIFVHIDEYGVYMLYDFIVPEITYSCSSYSVPWSKLFRKFVPRWKTLVVNFTRDMQDVLTDDIGDAALRELWL